MKQTLLQTFSAKFYNNYTVLLQITSKSLMFAVTPFVIFFTRFEGDGVRFYFSQIFQRIIPIRIYMILYDL